MANSEQVQLIRQGVEAWNRWRLGDRLRQPDLSGADLRHASLSRAGLSRADLSKADLVYANLSGANLSGAGLITADLYGANLSGADLSEADLSFANFGGANLSEANLSGATVVGTILGNSNLTGAKGLDTCVHRGPSIIDYQTLARSGPLPIPFLRGCGLPDVFIEYLPSLINNAIEFYSCFISYSHADKAFARRLYDALQGRGIRCWLDEKHLLPGDDIYAQVDRGIRLWDKTLLCCSEHSLKPASWVDKEIIVALEKEDELARERGDKVRVLIPLNLDGYLFSDDWKSGYRAEIRRRLAADFRGWEASHAKCEEEIEKVIRALRSDEQAREPPPKPRL